MNAQPVKQIVSTSSTTFPVWGLLCATLVVLKLLGKISLSWLWVFAPLWLPAAVALAFFGCLLVGALIIALGAYLLDR